MAGAASQAGAFGSISNWPISSFYSQYNWCHQMSDFKAKMHQICFPLVLCPKIPQTLLEELTRLLALCKRPTSKGR